MVILVVDSVSLVLRILDRLLTTHGHEVVTANSCEDALHILKRNHRIRLVLTDYYVGKMTASELFKADRKIERISDDGVSCPPEFILLTRPLPENDRHGSDVQLLQEVLDLGFVDVLFKPLDRDALLSHVRQIDGSDLGDFSSSPEPNRQKPAADASRLTEHFRHLDEK